jgi:hypothetical protein
VLSLFEYIAPAATQSHRLTEKNVEVKHEPHEQCERPLALLAQLVACIEIQPHSKTGLES